MSATATRRRLLPHAALAGAVLAGAVLAAGALVAARRPLWNDELFTWHFAHLPTFGDVWRELGSGAEQLPPFYYALTRVTLDLLGSSAFALRVPALAGFALMAVCLFAFVARRASPLHGAIAVLFTFVGSAGYYASEARPYALVLGFAAAACLAWQVATDGGRHRRLATVALGLSLALALASHHYAVLLVVPFALAELVRWRLRGEVDRPVVAAIAAAPLALLPSVPLLVAASDYSANFWARPDPRRSLDLYVDLLEPRAAWLAVAAVLAAGAALALLRPGREEERRVPPAEVVLLASLVALPVLGTGVAMLATGAFTERYAVAGVVGLAALLGLAARRVDTVLPAASAAVAAVLVLWAALELGAAVRSADESARRQATTLAFLRGHARDGVPLVVSSPHEFLVLSHATSGEGPRLTYLADPARALRRFDTDTVELGLLALGEFAPLTVRSYDGVLASAPRFLVYGRDGAWDWLTGALRADGARMTVRARTADDVLFDVRPR